MTNLKKYFAWIFTGCLFLMVSVTSCTKEKVEKEQASRDEIDVADSDYGLVTIDNRDYKTVRIGSQIWTEENFEGGAGVKPDGAKPNFGKYYTYAEAAGIELPEGWRLPTENDFYKLFQSQKIKIEDKKVTNPIEIKRLTSTQLWVNVSGNNKSGFNALPAGYVIDKQLAAPGLLAEYWTLNGTTVSIQEHYNLTELRLVFYAGDNSNTNKFNIRFVKDL